MSQAIDHEIRVLRAQFWSSRDPEGRAFAPLADAYRRKGDLEEAATLVEDGLARLPEFTPGHLISSRIARARGDLDRARSDLDHLLELDRENVLALLERSEVARETDDRESAVADLRQLLALDPGHLGARAALERLEAAPSQREPDSMPAQGSATPEHEAQGEEAAASSSISGFEATSIEDEEVEEERGASVAGFEAGEEALEEREEPVTEFEAREESVAEWEEPEESVVEFEEPEGVLLDFDEASFAELDDGTAGLMEPRENEGLDLDDLDFSGALEPEEAPATEPTAPIPEADLSGDEKAFPVSDSGLAEPLEGESGGEPVEAGPEPRPRTPSDPADEIPAHLMTRTMAEIYGQQGLISRAIRIYQALAARHPDDEEVSVRLAELREAEREREEAEPDLQQVAPQWAGDADDEAERSSPFAWGPEIEETETAESETAPYNAAAPGRSIRGHFDDLLAWAPGAVPISDLAPDADPERAPQDSPLARSLEAKAASDGEAASDGDEGADAGAEPDAGDGDDDLDDFRSWLKSLDS